MKICYKNKSPVEVSFDRGFVFPQSLLKRYVKT